MKKKYGFTFGLPFDEMPKKPKRDKLRVEFHLDCITDAELIKKLNSYSNRSDYIRKLIQKDLMNDTQ